MHAVGHLAGDRASHFGTGAQTLAEVAGLLHDLGKYCSEFQERLCGSARKVDHATWGARVAIEKYGPDIGTLLAYAIAGHHAGLADGVEEHSGQTISPLNRRLAKPPETRLDPVWHEEVNLPSKALPPAGFKLHPNNREIQLFQLSLLGRMLYSCLVDADFIDTDNYYRRLEGTSARNNHFPSLSQLKAELDHFLSQDRFQSDKGVNSVRRRILAHAREQSELEPGLFTLNVPTGGGKTLSSLAFALDHAVKFGLRRVILVIPFTSIVEQNAAVWRDALGLLGEQALLEHHSAYDQEKVVFDNPASKDKLRLAAENWDAPIVVTTAVQFFESLFANRSSRCRKLHNIANSVVILDEAQTLPVKLLQPCVAMMKELAINYRASLVLCTATQPALIEERGFTGGLPQDAVREIAPDPDQLHQDLARVSVIHVGKKSDYELINELLAQQQVLCIVNNREHARALFDQLRSEGDGAYHLTTLMCAAHRTQVLAAIREKLQVNACVRLVSTSLIEAGVDVDFPSVYRAEAGLDSIAQAAGRCNREGRFTSEDSLVKVFEVADDWSEPPELSQYASAFRSVYRQHAGQLLMPAAVEAYFNEVYWLKGQELDYHQLLRGVLDIDKIPYERIASQFKMIDSPMQAVIVKYDDHAEALINDLSYVERAGSIARQLQRYLVQVPKHALTPLLQAGAVSPINQKRFGEQFLVLENQALYSDQAGLSWREPAYMSASACVF